MPICIGVDCDEVLSETINELIKYPPLKEKNLKRSDITSYELYEVQKIGLTKEEMVQAFFSFFESPEYYLCQPVSGAYENEIPKSQLCKDRGIQLLIDDITFNIDDMNTVGIPGFLLDKPRNQGVKDSEGLHRVYSRDEIDLSQFFELDN